MPNQLDGRACCAPPHPPGKHPSISCISMCIVPRLPSCCCTRCKNSGTSFEDFIVNSSPSVCAVRKAHARPVLWNSLRIGCCVCGAMGRPLLHFCSLVVLLIMFFPLSIAYGTLKAPFVSYEANLFHPRFLYSIAQCLIMSLSDPLLVPMSSELYIDSLSLAVFAEYLSIFIGLYPVSLQ